MPATDTQERDWLAEIILDHPYIKGNMRSARQHASRLINKVNRIQDGATVDDAVELYREIIDDIDPENKNGGYPYDFKRVHLATLEAYMLATEQIEETPFIDYKLRKREKQKARRHVDIPRKKEQPQPVAKSSPLLSERNVEDLLWEREKIIVKEGEARWVLEAIEEVYNRPALQELLGERTLTFDDIGYAAKKLYETASERQRQLLDVLTGR